MKRVDEVRLDFIQAQLDALDFTALDAKSRARLFLRDELVAAPAIFASQSPWRNERLLVERHRFSTKARIG